MRRTVPKFNVNQAFKHRPMEPYWAYAGKNKSRDNRTRSSLSLTLMGLSWLGMSKVEDSHRLLENTRLHAKMSFRFRSIIRCFWHQEAGTLWSNFFLSPKACNKLVKRGSVSQFITLAGHFLFSLRHTLKNGIISGT